MAIQNVRGASIKHDQMFPGRGRCPKISLAGGLPHTAYLANRVPSTTLGDKTPFSMWHGGTPPRLERLRTFGARAFVHEERYVKRPTTKAWEGRMVGYGKDSKTYWIRESGTKIVESRNVTFIETLPVKLNAFDHDHNDGNDDTFLDRESSSHLARRRRCRKQTQMPNRTPVKAIVGAQ